MLRPASAPPKDSGQHTISVIVAVGSSASGATTWAVVPAPPAEALGLGLGVGVGLPEAGPEEPKSMRTTKMSAMSGITMAAIILLRSAGVFPSNRAMNLNSLRIPTRRRVG